MDFIHRFLDRHDAVVEESNTGLDVLMSERLIERLGAPEFIHLKTDPGKPVVPGSDGLSKQTFSIAYGSEFLERVLRLASEDIPLLSCQADFHYLKSQGFDALIRECFQFKGGLTRVDQWAKVLTQYAVLTCRYRAQSDEQKEGLCELALNLETGAYVAGLTTGLDAADRRYGRSESALKGLGDSFRTVLGGLKKVVGDIVLQETAAFQESMNRKFRRDVLNLEEYYQSLEHEMRQSLDRSGLSDQLVQDRLAKIALIPEELSRKKDDLFKKYSIRISVFPCAVLLVSTPAIKVFVTVAIGKKQKTLSAFYNPITKTLDPLVCEGCRGSTTRVEFCEQSHLLCPECSGRCPRCRK
jgi:hypothetical protein